MGRRESVCDWGHRRGRLNYWVYGAGYLFAPKASYTSGKEKEPEREFKDLVKEFHKNDIEVLDELYFTGEESAALAQEAVRFWVYEYHVDACTCPVCAGRTAGVGSAVS